MLPQIMRMFYRTFHVHTHTHKHNPQNKTKRMNKRNIKIFSQVENILKKFNIDIKLEYIAKNSF